MTEQDGLHYKDAGVDIALSDRIKQQIKTLVTSTFQPGVLSDFGGFSGLFSINDTGLRNPVIVASVDGVGTKLKIAVQMDIHNTVGKDLVFHSVNDVLVHGAKPLFFMDYIATSKLNPSVVKQIIVGIVEACKSTQCALLGGETAELPGFYQPGEYELAGFIIGIVEKEKIIDGTTILPQDIVLGLAANGLHTNGYSLARKVLFEVMGLKLGDHIPELGTTLGEELLKCHRCYANSILSTIEHCPVKGIAHITGGGFFGNIPRILPSNCAVRIRLNSWKVLPIFRMIQQAGKISVHEMYRTFNMGIGMVIIVSKDTVDDIADSLKSKGETVYQIGEIISGNKEVYLV